MNDFVRSDVVRVVGSRRVAPPLWIELLYYAITVYGIMSVAWGISVPRLAVSGLAVLAAACVVVARNAGAVHRALALPLLCGVTFLAVQVAAHGQGWGGSHTTAFVPWMLSVTVAQMLVLRPGFLHRFVLVCFVIGLLVVPFMNFRPSGAGVARAGLDDAVSIANPNDLGAWLGFCCVYFITLGVETRRLAVRLSSWAMALTALLIVGLTVSRAPLFSVALVAVIAFRKVFKRGFVPVLLFFSILWVVYGLGVFDQALGYYAARGTEESGRLVTWPLVLKRIQEAPLFGVGFAQIQTWVPSQGQAITPHNSYLLFPLASGIVPTALFLAYIARALWRTLFRQSHPELRLDAPFRFPLLLFLVLSCFSLDFPFMSQWGVVTLSLATSVVAIRPTVLVRRPTSSQAQSPQPAGGRYVVGTR